MLCVYKDKWPLYPEKIKTSNDNGEDESTLPHIPWADPCHLRQSLQSTGQGPCIWPIQDEGQEIRPIRSRDKKSNRSYTKGQVPVFLQDTGTRRLLIKKTRFISGTTFLLFFFFCFVLKSVKETGSYKLQWSKQQQVCAFVFFCLNTFKLSHCWHTSFAWNSAPYILIVVKLPTPHARRKKKKKPTLEDNFHWNLTKLR